MKRTQEIYVMTDKEFYEMKRKEQKAKILGDLITATKKDAKSFSVKQIDDPDKKKSIEKKQNSISDYMDSIKDEPVTDEDWENLMMAVSDDTFDASPITDITDENMVGYRLASKDGEDDYDSMFKKEQAMLAEVLKEVNGQTKILNKKLKDLTSKSSYSGVSKYYSDMLNASNGLNSTKLSIIKTMSDLKTKQEEFKLKRSKLNPEQEMDNDTLVDQYYKSIINGGRAEFVNRAMSGYSPLPSDHDIFNNPTQENDQIQQGTVKRAAFNITQPIPSEYRSDVTPDYEDDGDPFGYIQHEKDGVDVCVERFGDGSLQFIALDANGESVDDYELPGDDLLTSLSIKPMSKYAMDITGRKYKIIDIETGGVDLDDIDDMEYPYGDTKY